MNILFSGTAFCVLLVPDTSFDIFDDEIKDPVIVWWTHFIDDEGSLRTCGSHRCFFTVNRRYRHHPQLKVCPCYVIFLYAD